MGLALESILGFKSDLAGGGFEALTAGLDDSFQIRNFPDASRADLEEVWACDDSSPFQLSIKSPLLHDQVRGILLAGSNLDAAGGATFNPQTLLPGSLTQQVQITDTLQVQVSGVIHDVFAALFNIRYDNLPGANARLFDWQTVYRLIKNYVGILVQPVGSATKGQWGAGVALNSVDDRLHADRDYAVLGWQSSIPVTAVAINGIDTGNLWVGGPGGWNQEMTGDIFVRLAQKHGVPHIPVINSNNQGSTLIRIADVAAATAPNVTVILAELSSKLPST